MTTFFTADSHFGDAHILRYRGSHFADLEAHDEALVARWNAVVGPEDDLWHLGDFAAGASRERCGALFERLHGRKRLVCGNHDTRRVLELPWLAVVDHARITIEEDGMSWRLFLAHYAHRAWPGLWRGTRHLYGHTHGTLPDTTLSCDVGVDAWDYRPMTLAAVAARQDGATLLPEELARDRASARDRAARPGAVAAAPPQSDATC
ncbi:metallophosphoesterase [Lichenihabitans sp. Uapishka_5]|uniref:metallophosphoesterase n=1 Tax=Lichenihabitans sp. Uapishka_5 TaxID=3037302 RepID=UPI0029E7E425|nr:metallophosphoesterase [Lichenihabitans sp. Uapishka_5]MDX7953183.1 metallophosphoesterase [Lichenihabitans sp. Uapishka_5]